MLGEFRDFAMRGNMLDMAVGIIVGAAFGGVVSSFVSDVLMPPIRLFTGRPDFSGRFIVNGTAGCNIGFIAAPLCRDCGEHPGAG